MVANILSDGEGRNNVLLTHAYELSWHQDLAMPVFASEDDWKALNISLRDLFFFELNKLKQNLVEEEHSVFCHWQEYLNKDFSKAKERQHQDAAYAIYDFSNINENSNQQGEFQSIGAKKESSGTLFIIENPARFHQTIPAGSIVLAPYFDNRWVHNIQNLAGIITHKGSQLSHSAIVAREYGVPFCVVGDEAVKEFKQGDEITLDGIQLRIL
jgi:pyruvate,water dikinase